MAYVPLAQQQRFARRRTSVAASRDFVARTLAEWGVAHPIEDLMLCVSELATNALLHGVPAGREFCVRLSATSELVRLEVRDSGPGRPTVQPHDESACSGRGLRLVNELADDFGVDDHLVGKTVWAIFKTATAAVLPAGNH